MDKLAEEIKYLLECYRDSPIDKDEYLERVRNLRDCHLISEEACEFVFDMWRDE